MPFFRFNFSATGKRKLPCDEKTGLMAGKKFSSKPKYPMISFDILLVLKSKNIPSDNADTEVVISPVSFMAIKSPGSITLSMRAYISGSFSLTQANFEAVKLPGEFSKCDKHFS